VRAIRTVPTQVAAPRVFSRVAVGGETVCAVETGGALWCWGDNDQGQVGTGTSDGQTMPVRIGESGAPFR
jgi:alpha-tubulin suppressor-like RCC1 family protein